MSNSLAMKARGKRSLKGGLLIWVLILCLAIITAALAIWAGKQPDYSDLSQLR
jgi:hypothetical protein